MADMMLLPMDTRRFYLALGGLILAAWGLLITLQSSPFAGLLSHEAIGDHGFPSLLRLAGFLLGWSLMTIAMMLPGSLPLLFQSIRPFWGRTRRGRAAGLTLLGYLAGWAMFGLLVYLGDFLLHRMAGPGGPLEILAGSIPASIMLGAGIYQLTPLKRSLMKRCRPGHELPLISQVKRLSDAGALKQGMHMGIVCVGSCWPMMLLMFAVGHNRLDWMLALGGVMAVERLTPWGQRMAWVVGFALILWATVWMLGLGSAPAGHSHP